MKPISLKTEHLTCIRGEKAILNDLSLTFAPGTFYGILGPNGSGKTTLMRHLCGLLRPQKGSVLLNNTNLLSLPRKHLAKHVSFLPQQQIIPDIPVETLVSYGRYPHLGFSHKLSTKDCEIVQNAMQQTGTTLFAQRSLSTLSGGERQRAFLAMLLAQDTEIILLDEPTTYLDIRHQFEIMELCRALCSNGKTVIAVLHDIPLALSSCDHLIVLNDGCCAATGTPNTLYESGEMERIFGIRLNRGEIENRIVYTQFPCK